MSPAEREQATSFRVAKRRVDWLLGRWTAKQALMSSSGLTSRRLLPIDVEVRPTPSGEPRIFVGGKELAVGFSLSHRAGAALCAVVESGRVGCDLEWIEDRSLAFVEDYFGPAERRWIRRGDGQHRACMANGLWTAKESVMKVLGVGLRLEPRGLEVRPQGPCTEQWESLQIRYDDQDREFSGWWRRMDNWVMTVVADPTGAPPRQMTIRQKEG